MRFRGYHGEDHIINSIVEGQALLVSPQTSQTILSGGTHQSDLGQPYAFRQAGLTMGIVLLVTLTITVGSSSAGTTVNLLDAYPQDQVDWTIRLIVVNSKLSGANSFQATMEYCFGKSGLIAISVRPSSCKATYGANNPT